MTGDLHEWSAVRLARALATRELSAQALAAALVERTRALDPGLKAWSWFDAGHVRAAARALDAQSARGPLHGLPLGPKDNIDTAGIPTEYGSSIYAGHVPKAHAACIGLALAAGAYVFAKGACTELANMTPCATRHPSGADHTPGGSSSGSVAAVAAGLVPLALGTQTAGSVIRPASYCGIVGYKPSVLRIPRAGVKANSDTLDEVGVFARSVADVALLTAVVSARAAPGPAAADAGTPRLGVTLTTRAAAATPAMVALVEASARRLAAAGAPVRDAALPAWFDALFDAQRTVQAYEAPRALAGEWAYRRDALSPQLAALLEEGERMDGAAYAQALAAAQAGQRDLEALFGDDDVLLAPAATGEAPRGLGFTGDPLFCRPWQLLGCPCVTVPAGTGENGLPLGLQLVARPQQDERLLAAAAWVEARLRD